MDDFYKVFKQEEADLSKTIDSILDEKCSKEEKQRAVDKSLAGIGQLSEKVRDAAGSLPTHDLQTYTKTIDLLKKRLKEVRATSAPPPRFTFKRTNRQQPTEKQSTESQALSNSNEKAANTSISTQKGPKPLPSLAKPPPGFKLSSLEAAHYALNASTLETASIASLEAIQGSVVDISIPPTAPASFSTLMVKTVQSSLLMCGSISGSAHVTELNDSTIIITARQLRLHHCHNVVVYLHCSSRPIIEDCKEIRFAPLPTVFVKDDTTGQRNLWDQVDDFKWLRPEPSPNWGVLKSDDSRAIADESWKTILDVDSPTIQVKDRLQCAKVKWGSA